MSNLLNRLFDVSRYQSPLERSRALLIQIFFMIGLFLFTLNGLVIPVTPDGRNMFQLIGVLPYSTFAIPSFYILLLVTMIALKRGLLRFASITPAAAWYIISVGVSIQSGFTTASSGMGLVILVLLAGLLNETRGIVVSTVIALLSLAAGVIVRLNLPDPPNGLAVGAVSLSLVLIGASAITYAFIRFARLSRSEGIAQASDERIRLAELTTQFSQRISRRERLDTVLPDLVEQIRESYPEVYHAQVFLIDETGQEARLVASTGETGQLLLARNHALAVGSVSVIGQVMLRKEAIIARANDPQGVHRRNEFLPDTAAEAAFPLLIGDVVIGALDLQSKNPRTFDRQEIVATYHSLADSIAIGIDNARLFEQIETRLRENQRLVEQKNIALREAEQMNERLTGRAWSEYLRTRPEDLSYSFDFDEEDTKPSIEREREWTSTLAEAVRLNYLVQDTQQGRRVVAVPLRVRGQVIGAMEFELGEDEQFSSEELNLVQEVSERFGLAAENTRLLEESQRLAQREALVNEIGTRLQATHSVENTLSEAARSLRDSLKAAKVSIRIGPPPRKEGK